MRVLSLPAVRALGLTLILPVAAAAQQGPVCEVDEGKPGQVARALVAVQVASGATDPAAVAKQLTSAVKLLTDKGEQMSNQVGRNMVLGKALVLWSMQPNVALTTNRGALGYATDQQGTVDLTEAIDAAFKVVEAAHPECVTETSRWRGQKAWVDLVNVAIERMNADDVDSAQKVAARAIRLNPHAPYGYTVMANVLQKKGQGSEAFRLYRQAVDVAAKDTVYRDIGRQSLFYLGNLAADSAEIAADAAGRKPYVDIARGAFEEILKDKDAGDMASSARAGLCRVAIATGDTAQLRQTYRDPLASPATFSYKELMDAGVCMARAEMVPEAATLFAGALQKNPHHRDALSNLAIMHLRRDDHDAALPLAVRLEQVEPNNPENLQLLVLSYAGIAKRASDARKAGTAATTTKGARPAAGRRLSAAAADSLFKIEKAYTDSAVRANARKEGMTVRVSLSDFTSGAEKASLAGSLSLTGVEVCDTGMWDPADKKCRTPDGKTAAGKSAEGSYIVTVEFLDDKGNVVSTQKTEALPLSGTRSARFNVAVTAPGITAFRYRVDKA